MALRYTDDEEARLDREAQLQMLGAPGLIAPTDPNLRGALEVTGNGDTVSNGGINGAGLPATPSYIANGPAMGLKGFDQGKISSGHVSPKYVFAKHAQGLGVNDRDELLRRLQGDESGYFKNASWGGSKGDRLVIGGDPHADFNGLREFDVIEAMGEGGKGWQWGGIDNSQPTAPAMGGNLPTMGYDPGNPLGTLMVPTDESTYRALIDRISRLTGNRTLDDDAMAVLLGGR